MTYQQDHLVYVVNIPIVATLISTPWWLDPVTKAVEEFHWLAGMLILPVLGIVLAALQVSYMIRKHKHLGEKDSR